jgi:predicted HD superfamily hydrolase involved in NAD metabolism
MIFKMILIEDAYKYLKENLEEKRYMHTLGVVSVAKKLAEINGVPKEKAEIAALSHDIAKNIKLKEIKEILKGNNIILSEYENKTPELWHSIAAPIVAKDVFKIEDEDVLGAVRWHTTGKENMSTLEKIIYIADMIEPSRRFDGLEEIRRETMQKLEKGVFLGLTHTIEYLLSKGQLIDINTINARNYLLIHEKEELG